jgi:hypothetical protein
LDSIAIQYSYVTDPQGNGFSRNWAFLVMPGTALAARFASLKDEFTIKY